MIGTDRRTVKTEDCYRSLWRISYRRFPVQFPHQIRTVHVTATRGLLQHCPGLSTLLLILRGKRVCEFNACWSMSVIFDFLALESNQGWGHVWTLMKKCFLNDLEPRFRGQLILKNNTWVSRLTSNSWRTLARQCSNIPFWPLKKREERNIRIKHDFVLRWIVQKHMLVP